MHYLANWRQKEKKIKIRILTPVHIGSGEEISPIEYFFDRESGQFHRLNMDSLFRDEKFKPHRERFIKEAARSRYIGQIINDHSLLRRHILYSLPVSSEARSYLLNNQTNVKAFIKSAGRAYIPGSSLKGSILSSLIWHVVKNNFSKLSNVQKENIKSFLISGIKESQRKYEEMLKMVFPWIAPGSKIDNPKFAHWLDVSDSNLCSAQDCLQLSLVRVKGARSGRELPILYESLKEGQIFEAELKSQEVAFSEKEILTIAHDFYSKVASKDEKGHPYKEKFTTEKHLVRLGQGSGAFSTSLLLLAEDLNMSYRLSPPRTRKRIADYIPMGFVEISY